MRDLYDVLGVARDATAPEIKRSYRKLAHRYHPDKNPQDKRAEERFKEVTHAYDVLGDAAKRQKYDRFGAAGLGAGGEAGAAAAGFAQNVGDAFSDIFGDLFGRRGGQGRGVAPERGQDRSITLEVDFATAAQGGERSVGVTRPTRCPRCQGTGAKPGTVPLLCGACGGAGEVRVQQGLFQVTKKCASCRGRGRMVSDPCVGCDGVGTLARKVQLKVRVPAGADTGTVLRYAGEGGAGRQGGPAGDLRVVLRVVPHPYFRRAGADLHAVVPITPSQAALGGGVEVPTLTGTIKMKVPAGTATGTVLRVRGKGLPRIGSPEARGDLHVTLEIETPQALTPAQQALYASLQELDDAAAHYPRRTHLWQPPRPA